MHKNQKKKYYLIKNIINYINLDKNLKSIFNHPNRKYNLKLLLKYVIQLLISGLSYRSITDYSNKKIHWNTIYKFVIKLQQYNVISLTYYDTVNKYISKNLKNNKNNKNILLTDTTLISNKLGIDNIGYNPQNPKHKVSKVSLITDVNGIPLAANIYKGSMSDSKILDMQLDEFIIKHPKILTNNNILLGDAGYDSNKLKNKVININIGKLLTARNKRNIKDKNKLEALKLSDKEKELLKKRIKVEHINAQLKKYKRLSLRYDKYSINYNLFLHLSCIDIILKYITR